jgi:hypothetical protein
LEAVPQDERPNGPETTYPPRRRYNRLQGVPRRRRQIQAKAQALAQLMTTRKSGRACKAQMAQLRCERHLGIVRIAQSVTLMTVIHVNCKCSIPE